MDQIMETATFIERHISLDFSLSEGRYTVRFARSADEIDQVLRLRFEVFNLELNEGFDASYINERDEDRFDGSCLHLIVIDNQSSGIIGTYRLLTIETARSSFGFYSSDEFALETLPFQVLSESVELGRACIAREHRNSRVLFLLWRGLAQFLSATGKRYLFGCCSLSTQDFTEGVKAYRQLHRDGHYHSSLSVAAREEFEPLPEDHLTADDGSDIRIPKLFDTYLRIGAKILSPPVIDRSFKTIDFLILVDTKELSNRYLSMFFG